MSDRPCLTYVLIFDRVPTEATQPRHFPWRERASHRARGPRAGMAAPGGLPVHLWRQRSRIRLTTLGSDLRRAVTALQRLRQRV